METKNTEKNITKFLEKEERYVLGKGDSRANIISILIDYKAELKPEQRGENVVYDYVLEKGGKVSLSYNRYYKTLEVIIHPDTPEKVAEKIREMIKR